MKKNIISIGILLGLVAIICMAGLSGSLSLGERENPKGGQENAAVMDMGGEERRESAVITNDEGVDTSDTEAGRRYPYTNPIYGNVGFLARRDIVTSRENENPENSVPEELTKGLSIALQNNALEDYVAGISAEYALLQEDEIMQYIREDTSGVLESFYYKYIEGVEEWFF